jgi:hypothetical protein
VFLSGQSAVQSGAELQAGTWCNVEDRRGRAIHRIDASPVFLFGRCVAVATRVIYVGGAAPLPNDHHTVEVAAAASTVSRLMEDRLIRSCLGIEAL